MSLASTNNPLLTNYFQFKMERVPNIVYFCQSAILPGIEFGVAEQPTILSHPIKIPVGSVRFEDLVLGFKIDEDMKNWIEIYDWIKSSSNFFDDGNTIPYPDRTYSQGSLMITNSSYKPKIIIKFRGLFPVKLSSIPFDTVSVESKEAIATATFTFTDYSIERLVNP